MTDRIHLKAPGGWINDPNGFIYFGGVYHLYYQYAPDTLGPGLKLWGHAVSRDLVTWEHKDIALRPSIHEDEHGCFSGSAVEHEGKMHVLYSGNRFNASADPDAKWGVPTTAQIHIESKDGMAFDNANGKRVVIPTIEDPAIGCMQARDPKVWRGSDAWYLILGTRRDNIGGCAIVYKSDDLLNWEYMNCVSKGAEFSMMWECPDYLFCDGGEVLMISPCGVINDGKMDPNHNVCIRSKFNEADCSIELADDWQFLDYGLDLYAAQSTVDAEGRRVIVAWARMPESPDGKWINMFAVPRVAEVANEHIYFRVHPNIRNAFSRSITSPKEAGSECWRVEVSLEDGESLDIGGFTVARKGNRVCTDRSRAFRDHPDYRMQFETPELKGGCSLEIFVEPNLIEVFVNDGEYAISNVVYDLSDKFAVNCSGEVKLSATM